MKLILREEISQEETVAILNNFIKNLTTVKEQIDKLISADSIQTKINELQPFADNLTNQNIQLNAVKTNIQGYLTSLNNNFGNTIFSQNSALADQYDTLSALLDQETTNTTSDKLLVKQILPVFASFNTALLSALEKMKEVLAGQIEDFIKVINNCLNTLDSKNFDTTNVPTEIVEEINNVNTIIADKNLSTLSISQLIQLLQQSNLVAIETELGLASLKTTRAQIKDTEVDEWKDLISKASGDPTALDSVWTNYYETEWGDNANKIKALGRAFKEDCLELGFISRTNPFIAFLKTNPEIISHIDKTHYAVIHNMFVRRILRASDLAKNTGTPAALLIRCFDFYVKSALDLWSSNKTDLVYCRVPGIVIDNINKLTFNNNRALQNQYRPNIDLFIKKLLFADALTIDTFSFNQNMKLNSLTDIEATLLTCGYTPAEKEQEKIEDSDFDYIVDSLRKDKNQLIQAIIYLASRYTTPSNETSIKELLNSYSELVSATFNLRYLYNISKLFNGKVISDDRLLALIKRLAVAGNLTKKA